MISRRDFLATLAKLAAKVGGAPDVPVHFTRFHPDYQLLNPPPTLVATLERAYNLTVSKGTPYLRQHDISAALI